MQRSAEWNRTSQQTNKNIKSPTLNWEYFVK